MITTIDVLVRKARESDIPALLELMRALAAFEDYIAGFAVDAAALKARAFGASPECYIWVTENSSGVLSGYAVALLIPYTYDLRPTILLKELFVAESARGSGAGKALMLSLAQWAVTIGAGRMKWDVLSGNEKAERFYRELGATRDPKWLAYGLNDVALRALAKE